MIVLDPLYSTHDQDENDTRSMAALCQSLLRLRDASKAALIVVHHVRKSIGRDEIGRAFRGSSALHAVGDSYLLLTRPSAQSGRRRTALSVSLCRAAGAATAQLEPQSLWFSAAGRCLPPSPAPKGRTRGCDPGLGRVSDSRRAITNCATRSCALPSAPSAPRNWRFRKPA